MLISRDEKQNFRTVAAACGLALREQGAHAKDGVRRGVPYAPFLRFTSLGRAKEVNKYFRLPSRREKTSINLNCHNHCPAHTFLSNHPTTAGSDSTEVWGMLYQCAAPPTS